MIPISPMDIRRHSSIGSKQARMNGGGTPIELHTTNGGIRIRSRSDAPSNTDDDKDKEDHDGDVKAPKAPKPPSPPSGERR